MSKIDRDIKDALKNTPKISSNINQNLAQQYAQEKYQRDDHETGETFILPVEKHRKPTLVKRVGAFAACFTAIAVLGGSAAAMSGLLSHPESSTQLESESSAESVPPEEVSDTVYEEATEAITEDDTQADYSELSYDMSTKEGIFAKMLNTRNFYNSISGKYVTAYCPQITDTAYTVTYQYDLTTGKNYSYHECCVLTNSIDDILTGDSLPEGFESGKYTNSENYCDGSNIYCLNFKKMPNVYFTDQEVQYEAPVNTVDVEKLLEDFKNDPQFVNSELFDADFNTQNPNFPKLNSSVFITVCLSDFENWDFEPTTTEYGDAVVINGSTIHYDRFDTPTTFTITVDCATGVILSYTEYDDEGNLYDYFVTHDLKINENAEPVPEIDMNDYTEYNDSMNYDFLTNSSGKTYAYKTVFAMHESYRELLPDYLAFSDGFINVDEFIETGGNMKWLQGNDTHQYYEPSETEELLYKLNLYDCEGNYIYSVYYYDGYIDQ